MLNHRRTPSIVAAFFVGILVCVGCDRPKTAAYESTYLPHISSNIRNGDVAVEYFGLTTNPNHTFFGPIIALRLKNLTSKNLLLTIEPGTTLHNDNPKLVSIYVVTAGERIALAPGESKNLTLEAFTTDFDKATAVSETKFAFGNMAGGDLGAFVKCFAERRPDRNDPTAAPDVIPVQGKPGEPPTFIVPQRETPTQETGKTDFKPVQLALWRITGDVDMDKLLVGVSNNPRLKGGEFSQSKQFFQGMRPYVQKLLDDCGLGQYKF